MSDKPIAGLLTAIAVAPLCLVCALAPTAFVAATGSFLAWLGSFAVLLIASALAIASWLVWRAFSGDQHPARRRENRVILLCGAAGIERAR